MNNLSGEFTLQVEIEGQIFQVTYGTEDLAETPGRIGLYMVSRHTGSSQKFYFDDAQSVGHLADLLSRVMNTLPDFQQ